MTPTSAHAAVMARLVAAGLTKSLSPLGIRNESNQRIDQSFSVTPVSVAPSPSPGRSQPTVAGVRVLQTFRIELGHRVKPGDGQDAPTTALTDTHTAMRYLAANATSLTTDGAIEFGTSTLAFEGNGAFLVTSFNLSVTYNLTLVI